MLRGILDRNELLKQPKEWYNEAHNFETAVKGVGDAQRDAADVAKMLQTIASDPARLKAATSAIVQRLPKSKWGPDVRKAALAALAKLDLH